MFAALRSTWAMFLGLGLIMTAGGLQSTLLGVRAGREGFATEVTGFIMSGYFAGFLVGSLLVPRLVGGVGHVRVFAALASLLSTAVLVHALLVEPVTWFFMRLLTGFASAGLYIVAESWLNDKSPNESRGQVLSLYMIVVLGSMGAGQFLMNLASPDGFVLFLGTMFAPVDDRGGPGLGFTHKPGDLVTIHSARLGALTNRIDLCDKLPPWTFGAGALMTSLARRGLL